MFEVRPFVCFTLGYCYENGIRIEKNIKIAKKLYNKAHELGNKDAATQLENIRNLKAFNYFNQAILFESTAKNINLECSNKDRVEKILEESAYFYEKSSKLGHPHAALGIRNLGKMYEKGQIVQQSYTKAFHLFVVSYNHGSVLTAYDLGRCYENGKGVEKNNKAAKTCYEIAAKAQVEKAIKALERLNKEIPFN